MGVPPEQMLEFGDDTAQVRGTVAWPHSLQVDDSKILLTSE
jgi:hypothetical protein